MKNEWQSKKLGDVCTLLNRGISPKYLNLGGICVLNQKCIRNHIVNFEQSRRHDAVAKKVSPERFIQLGDVLVNSTGTGTLGRIAQVRKELREPTTVDSHVTIVRPKPQIFQMDFFGYMLITIEDAIKDAGEGCGGQTELARSVLSEFLINYPTSIAEQQRIVSILDEAFEGITIAKANAEKNLQNAQELFESHLNTTFSTRRKEVKKHYPLADLCELIVDCEHKTAPTQKEGIPSIRTPNIGKGHLLLNGVYRVSEETYKTWTRRAEPRAGDLILAREAPAGNVAVIPQNTRLCLGQRTVLIRPKANVFDSEFLLFYLLSSEIQKKLLAHSRGATVLHVNMKDIRALEISSIPPLNVQQTLVSNINSMAKETQQLESIYKRKLVALAALKKSLLHHAFTGNL